MSNRAEKPKRSPASLVEILRDEKGITFNLFDEASAADYFSKHNNYLRTASYRKNYDKHITGPNAGKYIHLDFSYLVELSKLDMYLRSYLLKMSIDVEHAIKVALISDVESNPCEDGYSIVDDFLAQHTEVKNRIASKVGSVYTGKLITKYFTVNKARDYTGHYWDKITGVDCPIWVLVEILAFNDFMHLLEFYGDRYPGRISYNSKHLQCVRSLRNACAHNNCILVSLRPKSSTPMSTVTQRVAKMPNIGKEERKKKLSCRPLLEIVCLLIEFETWVSEDLYSHRMQDLKEFINGRWVKHVDFFSNNQTISTSIGFLKKSLTISPNCHIL